MFVNNSKYVVAETLPNQYIFDNKNSFAIPFGVGIKSKLAGSLAISLETRVRYTFDDDLDFTTENIPNLNFGSNNSDWYMFTGISFIYTFGRPPCYTNGL